MIKICPVCKSTEGVREFIYGMPDGEPDESRFIIGGCLDFENGPDYRCVTCSTDFYKEIEMTHNRFISDGSGIVILPPAQ